MSNCLNCNEPLEQTPGKKEKQFCNVSCRSSYWQKQKRANASAAPFQETLAQHKKAIVTDAPIEFIPLAPEPKQPTKRELPPVMPPGLTPTQQQAWKAEQRKKLQEGRFK